MSTVQTESLDSATAAHGTVAAVHGDVAVIKVDPAATGRVLVAASPTDVTPALPDAIAIWPGGEDAVALKPGDRIHVVDG
ncbi:MAG: hypothetical protein D6773_08550 [Alphaproteobacteria bacterium]|nr:MAG: hypothetical protein D6773_08550 [Alphaproteobacteria bacterium]